ncbi:flagellar hook-associated protein 3 [Marinobacter daqiaonensis]|uniref:Flagellar hook-associated protein 3 n=1 Tax=Marinobacter daqiaonensis TaxID=650891 RepID=A0A1I6GLE0_9GAMM|nr:flagellar hook-associated protein FlgL [Marinobacter daqiaonensis]SFR42877.1 flagellar hook-associated protein 3 [Marinobacter daqiaonensis]
MIRISSQQIFSGGVNRLQELNVGLNKTQEQVSTGKRVNRPSDDPVAAARILKLDQQVGRIETFQRNVSLAENRLQKEEGTLSSMVDVVQRVRELTVQAGNGSLSINDRQSISAELKERLGQLASLANTQDAAGEYIFSGFQGNTPAFGQNISGDWVYQGDEGQRKLEIDDGVTVPISDHGRKLFVDVASAGPTFFAEANPANTSGARISSGVVLDPELVAGLSPEDLVVSVEDDGAGNLGYRITERSSGDPVIPALATEPAIPYTSGESVRVSGMQFEITGAGAGDEFFLKTSSKQSVFTSIEKLIYGLDNLAKQGEAATVTAFAPAGGDSLTINDDVVLTFAAGDDIQDLADAINNSNDNALDGVTAEVVGGELKISSPGKDVRIDATGWTGNLQISGALFDDIGITGGAVDAGATSSAGFVSSQKAYDDLIAQSLQNLDNAQESIIRVQTEIGGRMNALESTGEFLDDSALYSKDIRSQLQDVDYAEAISNLSFQSFVLQAAQQSFAQTSQLSLFDRL